MNDEIVRFQNELIGLLQPHLEDVHDDEKLFPSCRVKPISRGEGMVKIRNVEFVCKTLKTKSGDSGAPVFRTSSTDRAYVGGIHGGAANGYAYHTIMESVEKEFNLTL